MSMVGGERLALHRLDDGRINRRFVPGAGLDEYAGYYHGPGTGVSARRWLLADHQGSVVAYTDASGEAVVINTYDEYGRAGPANAERLQYTGQFTLSPGLDLIHYRNRFYNPRLGRFMQTDPILYGDGLNLYAYVGNDPMNWVDPWGLQQANTIYYNCSTSDTYIGRDGTQVIRIYSRTCSIELRQISWDMPGSSLPGHVPGTEVVLYLNPDLQCQAWMIGDALNEAGTTGAELQTLGMVGNEAVGAGAGRAGSLPGAGGAALLTRVWGISLAVSEGFQWAGALLMAAAGDSSALQSQVASTGASVTASRRGASRAVQEAIGLGTGQIVDEATGGSGNSPC